jgi:hypothetical protein
LRLTAAEQAREDEEMAAYLTATAGDEPPEDAGLWVDPGFGEAMAEEPDPEEPDPVGATGGPGFASGSMLDELGPGPVLSAALEETCQAGLTALPDDDVAGVLLAGQRLEARGTAVMLAATAELARRRGADPDPRVGEHTETEIAMLLATSRRAGGRLIGFAVDMTQLPATSAALWEGRLDRVKAEVISYETGLLDPDMAAVVEQLVIEDAPRLTPSQLRARLHRAVMAADPDAARRRAAQAARDARVELFPERSGGTAALAGRDLPVTGAIAADQRIDAIARDLKAAGSPATLPQLRAAVLLGLLTGASPHSFLPPPDEETPAPARTGDSSHVSQPAPMSRDTTCPASSTSGPAATDTPGGPGVTDTSSGPGVTDTPGFPGTETPGPAGTETPGPAGATDAPGIREAGTGAPAARPTLRGSVHLTLPLATWLGTRQSPGDISGYGPATGQTCQELADWIAASPGTRWCLTLTDAAGHAVAHGCARRPPPPRTEPQKLAAWLARLKITPIQAGTCTHAREVPGYRIPQSLHHAVKIRQKTCASPICSRPAQACDDDHTVPYHQGGRTCECGLGPVCRCCHRVKQTPGWHLEQPTPGVLVWHLPNGRTRTTTPGIYPT